jgi:hypothetical protein
MRPVGTGVTHADRRMDMTKPINAFSERDQKDTKKYSSYVSTPATNAI